MEINALRARLDEGPLIVAEGFVFELERSCVLQAGAYVPSVVLENPGAVRYVTDRFIESGSDVVLALTGDRHTGRYAPDLRQGCVLRGDSGHARQQVIAGRSSFR